ncbi:uncharacterized protein LOC106168441 [Lingula anatina]|uniref:Uncharacterized protein LOC106168441 n=1 Tax=Lingula anatina TaxID=7574 RepID=A0A1S3IZG0_LINAN|nr:uncharacterized protein LOC106168441 [Lingula anatina]|eukprot:XP_013402939.2 uncharacterized protein LOC106168441 [Lingula anatina]
MSMFFDIGIPYQQCGKVIGAAGARIKLIEGATDTIIFITMCQDRIERDAVITAKTKEDILDVVELIEKLVAMDYNDIDAYRMIQEAQDRRFVSGAKKNLLTALDDVSNQLTEGNLRSCNVSLSSRSCSPSFTGSLMPSPTPDLNSNYIVTKDMRSHTPEPKHIQPFNGKPFNLLA